MNITEYIQQGIGQPRKLTLDLSIVLDNQEFAISGTQFGVWAAPLQTDEIDVRFNANQAVSIPFQRGRVLAVPFNKVFITVPAGLTGNMDILYGHGSMDLFRIFPNAFDTDMTVVLTTIQDQLQGDLLPENWGNAAIGVVQAQVLAANANRKSFEVQAGLGNAQTIYIGYTNLVTNLNAVKALVAGQSFWMNDYRGPVHAIAGGAGQVLHYLEV